MPTEKTKDYFSFSVATKKGTSRGGFGELMNEIVGSRIKLRSLSAFVSGRSNRTPIFSARKSWLSVRIAFIVILTASCANQPGVSDVVTDLAREELSVSALAINLQGIEDKYGNHTANWPERYGRIAKWMKEKQTFPDFIVLQEVHGQSTSNNQYQVLHTLLTEIKAQTTTSYRVAYLTVNPIGYPGSTLWQGVAILYNADRLNNITANANLSSWNYNDPAEGFQLRKSLPCQASHPTFNGLCDLIDGDGVSWISANVRSSRWVMGPVLARFELKDAQGSPIHIYNVHVPLGNGSNNDLDKKAYLEQFKDLQSQIETKLGSNRLYPPIVLGDFNLDVRKVLPSHPGFEIAGYSNREVMGVLVGTQNVFPSKQIAYTRSLVLPVDRAVPSADSSCGDADKLWSDHCGVLVKFSPAPGPAPVLPSGPTAQGSTMHTGEVLLSGESLTSANGKYSLRLLGDSNLLLIRNSDNAELWSPAQPNAPFGRPVGVARLSECKLVIYEKDGNQMWSSDTSPDLGISSELVVRDDGNVVIYQLPGRIPIWSSNTVQP